MELIHVIQKTAKDVVGNMNLTDLCYGEITNINPLSVRLSSQLVISGKLVRRLSSCPVLYLGDRILMLRAMNGSLYIILDKAVN